MAYRIASLGLAALLATTVLAQPMPGDVYVTTTCTERASVTVTVDQFGHTITPESPGTPPVVQKAQVDTKPKHNAVLNYGNFQHQHHHKAKPVHPPAQNKYVTPAQDVHKDSTTPAVVPQKTTHKKSTPKKTTPVGSGSGMGPGLSVRSGSEPVGSAIASASGGKVGWYHNWEPAPKAGGISGAQFCPMLHDTWGGDAQMWITAWASKPQSKCYLGQNEPDLTGQDAGSVAQAFTDTFLKGLPSGDDVTIACPSFTSTQGDANKGLGWYSAFEKACAGIAGCSYNTLQPHYYGYKPSDSTGPGHFAVGQPGFDNFVQFVQDVKTAAKGKKVWMTEYALGPSDGSAITSFTDDERAQFITDATKHLAGEVDAYAPYTVGSDNGPGKNEMTSATCSLASAFVSAC